MVMEVVGNGFCWGSVIPGCIQLFFSEGSQTRLGSPMHCRKCKLWSQESGFHHFPYFMVHLACVL
jgi:hypothetical protein